MHTFSSLRIKKPISYQQLTVAGYVRGGTVPVSSLIHLFFCLTLSSLYSITHQRKPPRLRGVGRVGGPGQCSVQSESWVNQLHTEGQNLGSLWDRRTDRTKDFIQDRTTGSYAPEYQDTALQVHSCALSTQYSTTPIWRCKPSRGA